MKGINILSTNVLIKIKINATLILTIKARLNTNKYTIVYVKYSDIVYNLVMQPLINIMNINKKLNHLSILLVNSY